MTTRILALLIMTARLKLIRHEVEAALWLGVPIYLGPRHLIPGAALAILIGAVAGFLLAAAP